MNELIASLPPDMLANAPVLLAALAVFVSIIALWQAMRVRQPVLRRARTVAQRQQELREAMLSPRRRDLRPGSQEVMNNVVEKFRLMQGKKTREIRDRLASAGLRSREALVSFLFFKLVLPVAFGLTAVLMLEVLKLYPMPPIWRIAAAVAAVLLGFYGPELWVKNRADKRRRALQKALPDALDLLVICVEAGLSLDAALKRSAAELARSSPELSDEFQLTSVELGFLPERAGALRNLARRTGLKPLSTVVSALLQTEKFGTPLAQSLRVLASEFRNERMLKAEEKAARLPATLTVPMVVFILPTLFIVLIGPAILRVIDNFSKMG